MRISKQAARAAKQLFKSCLRNGRLDEEKVSQAVRSLIESRPRDYLAVLARLRRLVKLEVQRQTALIETAVELDPTRSQLLRESIAKRYGPALRFEFARRPELIGGVRVQVGSDVFDGTIRARLEALKAAFTPGQQI